VPTDLRSQLFVGAFVTAPWSGKCEAPPTHDPRGGDPEPVSKVERDCDANSNIPEMTTYTGATGGKSTADITLDRTRTLSMTDTGVNDDKHGADQYLNDFAKHQGSGLGLFVANLCVEEMGGTIGFRCARDLRPKTSTSSGGAPAPMPLLGGSVFWFDFPFVPVSNKIYTRPPVQLRSLDSLRESLCDSIGQGSDSNSTRSWCKGFHSEDDLFGGCRAQERDINNEISQVPNSRPTLNESMNDCLNECVGIDSDSSSENASCDESPVAMESSLTPQTSPERPCVLVVDDSIMVQKLLCRSLASLNFETDTACNGREGLIKMKGKRYRAVLMDFLMPVMDGRSWTELLLQRSSAHGSGTRATTALQELATRIHWLMITNIASW